MALYPYRKRFLHSPSKYCLFDRSTWCNTLYFNFNIQRNKTNKMEGRTYVRHFRVILFDKDYERWGSSHPLRSKCAAWQASAQTCSLGLHPINKSQRGKSKWIGKLVCDCEHVCVRCSVAAFSPGMMWEDFVLEIHIAAAAASREEISLWAPQTRWMTNQNPRTNKNNKTPERERDVFFS